MSVAVDSNGSKPLEEIFDEKAASRAKKGLSTAPVDVAEDVAGGIARTNKGMTALSVGGTALSGAALGAGVAVAGYNISTAEDPAYQIGEELSAVAFSALGAEMGMGIGVVVGGAVTKNPLGAAVGGFVGAAAGGYNGDQLGRDVYAELVPSPSRAQYASEPVPPKAWN